MMPDALVVVVVSSDPSCMCPLWFPIEATIGNQIHITSILANARFVLMTSAINI